MPREASPRSWGGPSSTWATGGPSLEDNVAGLSLASTNDDAEPGPCLESNSGESAAAVKEKTEEEEAHPADVFYAGSRRRDN